MFGLELEQVLLVFFAGGPGLAALIVQVIKNKSEAPVREANLTKTLTTAADTMLERMQTEIDDLRKELRHAEDKIISLEAKMEVAQEYAMEAAKEREKRAVLELENARLRGDSLDHLKEDFDEFKKDNPSDDPE